MMMIEALWGKYSQEVNTTFYVQEKPIKNVIAKVVTIKIIEYILQLYIR